MIKEKAALLQKHDSELFGKKFRNCIVDTIKSKRETREIFKDSKKPFPWSPSYLPRRSEGVKSFSHQRRRIELRKIQERLAASFINRHKQVNKDMVNIHSSSRTFFNMNSVPEISVKWELENVHPLMKRLFSSNKVPSVPIAGRLKHF